MNGYEAGCRSIGGALRHLELDQLAFRWWFPPGGDDENEPVFVGPWHWNVRIPIVLLTLLHNARRVGIGAKYVLGASNAAAGVVVVPFQSTTAISQTRPHRSVRPVPPLSPRVRLTSTKKKREGVRGERLTELHL